MLSSAQKADIYAGSCRKRRFALLFMGISLGGAAVKILAVPRSAMTFFAEKQ